MNADPRIQTTARANELIEEYNRVAARLIFPMNSTQLESRALPAAAHKDRPTEFQQAILIEVFRLALSTPQEIADVFVEFSAHVGQICVCVFPQGWQRDLDAGEAKAPRTIEDFSVYVGDDRPEAVAYVPEFLTKVQAAIAACRPANAVAPTPTA